MASIYERRKVELSTSSSGASEDRRLPNSQKALLAASKPTAAELADPLRTIGNYKAMILSYQRELGLCLDTIDVLIESLSPLCEAASPNRTSAPGSALRASLRRMVRMVSAKQKRLKSAGVMGAHKKHANAASTLSARNEKIVRKARAWKQEHDLSEFLDWAEKQWPLSRVQLREIVSSIYPKRKRRARP